MQNNKNIKCLEPSKINRKKAHIVKVRIVLIFLVIAYLTLSFFLNTNNAYSLEEKDITGDTKIKLEVGQQKEIVYSMDRQYILQVDKVKKNNSNIAIIKTYTSESSPNKVFIELKGISKGISELDIYYNYTKTNQIVDKYSSIVKKVIVEVGNENTGKTKQNGSGSISDRNNNTVEGKVSETNIDKDNIESVKKEQQSGLKENQTTITAEDIDKIFNELIEKAKKDEELAKKKIEEDKEREQKKEEDKILIEKTKKEDTILKSIIIIFTIVALVVHIYKYVKFER